MVFHHTRLTNKYEYHSHQRIRFRVVPVTATAPLQGFEPHFHRGAARGNANQNRVALRAGVDFVNLDNVSVV